MYMIYDISFKYSYLFLIHKLSIFKLFGLSNDGLVKQILPIIEYL